MTKAEQERAVKNWLRVELSGYKIASWLYTYEAERKEDSRWNVTATDSSGRTICAKDIVLSGDGSVLNLAPLIMD